MTQLSFEASKNSDQIKYLSFQIGQRSFAFAISLVREIMEYVEVDPIPMAPDFIIGAINLRGAVIPVIDLSVRLGANSQPVTNRTCIIILEVEISTETVVIGLKVDLVSSVLDIDTQNIDPVPSIGGQFESRFVKGLAKLESGLLVILNVDKLMTLDELDSVQNLGISVGGESPTGAAPDKSGGEGKFDF